MEPFMKPYQLNYVKSVLKQLLNAVYFAGDYRVYRATKENVLVKIHEEFPLLTSEQQALFKGIEETRGQDELNDVVSRLAEYVIPFPTVTPKQIQKLFPKVKKLTMPDFSQVDYRSLTYLGWRDVGANAIYVVHETDGSLAGTYLRYTLGSVNNMSVCSVCGQARSMQEIGLVVATSKKNLNKSVGTHMCLNSEICNQNIKNTGGLEAFLTRLSS